MRQKIKIKVVSDTYISWYKIGEEYEVYGGGSRFSGYYLLAEDEDMDKCSVRMIPTSDVMKISEIREEKINTILS